ncbi:MAG TPA: hypothetical protein DCG48_04420 [Rhodospirillaceae bacterium]|nr:hypothetical protein [Rhodospirillaceae bacterium]|tara:strand:+ start:14463 stop:14765 length:303 start_codon:yes stop_codon:yes gene_type:complete
MTTSRAMRRQMKRLQAQQAPGAAEAAWIMYMRRRCCRGAIRVAASEGKRDKAAEQWIADNPEAPDERRLAISYQLPRDHCVGLADRLRAAETRIRDIKPK